MKNSVLFLILCSNFNILNAQTSLNSGGTDITHKLGMVSYSIGQTFYQVSENSIGAIYQGVHHSYKIESINTTSDLNKANIDVFIAFPNPTKDFLTLQFTGGVLQDYIFILYDVTGRKIIQQTIKNKETMIELSNLKPGMYIIQIMQRNNIISVKKIIKAAL